MTEPLHRRIRHALEEEIHSGRLVPGSRLPTEHELRAEYGVSRATAQRVLNDLASSGLAVRRRRAGTFVADLTPQLDLLAYAAPEVAGTSVPGRHVVLSSKVVPAEGAVHPLPGVGPTTAVVELVRLKVDVRDRPMQIERHVVLFSAAPDLLDQDLETLVSLRYLQDRGSELGSIRVFLDPVNLTRSDAELLQSEPGAATLTRRRETLAPDGSAVEVVATVVRPGAARFFVEVPVDGAAPRGGGQ
ncbi:GntR family transcriptional regulator [Pseudonocardia alni]|uniref:GntR family transcriptional regulator n=1 Tax=Pseudonocardia alni TaxID=33907 RepID=UPI00280B0EB9|nr:GntR family transcriptional regulator [Pseudonocardia alni]